MVALENMASRRGGMTYWENCSLKDGVFHHLSPCKNSHFPVLTEEGGLELKMALMDRNTQRKMTTNNCRKIDNTYSQINMLQVCIHYNEKHNDSYYLSQVIKRKITNSGTN